MNEPKYYVFLDDIREPGGVTWVRMPMHEYEVVRNYDDFVKLITNKGYPPSFICYDHDLADSHYQPITVLGQNKIDYSKYKEKTGYDCAKWMVNYCENRGIKHPGFVVHSMNPVGRVNIVRHINNYNNNFDI